VKTPPFFLLLSSRHQSHSLREGGKRTKECSKNFPSPLFFPFSALRPIGGVAQRGKKGDRRRRGLFPFSFLLSSLPPFLPTTGEPRSRIVMEMEESRKRPPEPSPPLFFPLSLFSLERIAEAKDAVTRLRRVIIDFSFSSFLPSSPSLFSLLFLCLSRARILEMGKVFLATSFPFFFFPPFLFVREGSFRTKQFEIKRYREKNRLIPGQMSTQFSPSPFPLSPSFLPSLYCSPNLRRQSVKGKTSVAMQKRNHFPSSFPFSSSLCSGWKQRSGSGRSRDRMKEKEHR